MKKQSIENFRGKTLEVFEDTDDEKFIVGYDLRRNDPEDEPYMYSTIGSFSRRCDAEFFLKSLKAEFAEAVKEPPTGHAIRTAAEACELTESDVEKMLAVARDPTAPSGRYSRTPKPVVEEACDGGEASWRCFHCDVVFTSRKYAAEHFGADEGATPACRLSHSEGHLVTYIRKLQRELASYRREDNLVLRAWDARVMEGVDAVRRAEETGFNRGVQDAKKLFEEELRIAAAGAVPEDDGELVTEGWLRSVGFIASSDAHSPFLYVQAPYDSGFKVFVDRVTFTTALELPDDGVGVNDIPWGRTNRGHIRRLCSALCISLPAAGKGGK